MLIMSLLLSLLGLIIMMQLGIFDKNKIEEVGMIFGNEDETCPFHFAATSKFILKCI